MRHAPPPRCRVLLAAVLAALLHAAGAGAEPSDDPFTGITIIRIDEEASIAIAGNYGRAHLLTGRELHLVTFVSPRGTFATIAAPNLTAPCVAWSASGGSAGDSITFGIDMGAYEGRPGRPWCQPFTLVWRSDGKVRLTADNEVPRYGLKGQGEMRRHPHDDVHDVVAQIPLSSIDLGLAVFADRNLHGVRLGPIRPGEGRPRVKVHRGAAYRGVEILFDATPSQPFRRLNGVAAPAELTGWDADHLIALWNQDRPEPRGAEHLEDRYTGQWGAPTMSGSEAANQAGEMWWLYDSAGRLIEPGGEPPNSCAVLMDLWRGNTLWTFNRDLGPWGCSLVMLVGQNGLRQEMVAGNAMAYRHFMERLAELQTVRGKLGVAASAGRVETVVVQGNPPAPPA